MDLRRPRRVSNAVRGRRCSAPSGRDRGASPCPHPLWRGDDRRPCSGGPSRRGGLYVPARSRVIPERRPSPSCFDAPRRAPVDRTRGHRDRASLAGGGGSRCWRTGRPLTPPHPSATRFRRRCPPATCPTSSIPSGLDGRAQWVVQSHPQRPSTTPRDVLHDGPVHLTPRPAQPCPSPSTRFRRRGVWTSSALPCSTGAAPLPLRRPRSRGFRPPACLARGAADHGHFTTPTPDPVPAALLDYRRRRHLPLAGLRRRALAAIDPGAPAADFERFRRPLPGACRFVNGPSARPSPTPALPAFCHRGVTTAAAPRSPVGFPGRRTGCDDCTTMPGDQPAGPTGKSARSTLAAALILRSVYWRRPRAHRVRPPFPGPDGTRGGALNAPATFGRLASGRRLSRVRSGRADSPGQDPRPAGGGRGE